MAGILKVSYRRMQEILGEPDVLIELSPEDVEEEKKLWTPPPVTQTVSFIWRN